MRFVSASLILFLFIGAATYSLVAQDSAKKLSPSERFGGTWSGSFDGDISGKFEMSIMPAGANSKHTGKVIVTPDEGDSYTASFKSLTLEGDKLVGKYDDPSGNGEVMLEGTSDGKAASGTWTYSRQDNQAAKGMWKLTRKDQ